MYTTIWILFLISFIIFFRSDLGKIIKKIENYPYLVMTGVLGVLNYLIIINMHSFHQFILVFGHLLLALANQLLNVFAFLGLKNPGEWARWFLKFVIFGFLLFYPLYYQKKYKSLVYMSERKSIRVIYFALTVFFYFFCLHFRI